MKHTFATQWIAAGALMASAVPVFAHITLQDGVAAAGANYRATLRVGHGCDGSITTGIRVTIPIGFNGAQPMPKPGWTLATKSGPLTQPFVSHGKTYAEGVQEISWTASGRDSARSLLRRICISRHHAYQAWLSVVQGSADLRKRHKRVGRNTCPRNLPQGLEVSRRIARSAGPASQHGPCALASLSISTLFF
jgi:uncharacterized protein YcnI